MAYDDSSAILEINKTKMRMYIIRHAIINITIKPLWSLLASPPQWAP